MAQFYTDAESDESAEMLKLNVAPYLALQNMPARGIVYFLHNDIPPALEIAAQDRHVTPGRARQWPWDQCWQTGEPPSASRLATHLILTVYGGRLVHCGSNS